MAATLTDEFMERAGRLPGRVKISTVQTTTSISITIDSAFPLPSDTTAHILRCRDQCTLAERMRYEVPGVDADRCTSLVVLLKRARNSLSVSYACTCTTKTSARSPSFADHTNNIQEGTLLVAFASTFSAPSRPVRHLSL